MHDYALGLGVARAASVGVSVPPHGFPILRFDRRISGARELRGHRDPVLELRTYRHRWGVPVSDDLHLGPRGTSPGAVPGRTHRASLLAAGRSSRRTPARTWLLRAAERVRHRGPDGGRHRQGEDPGREGMPTSERPLLRRYASAGRGWLSVELVRPAPDRGVRTPDAASTDRSLVYVKTYRDVLLAYLGHPEAKSLERSGGTCRRDTHGVLTRRPVAAAIVTHIGKESNRLDERLSGLVTDEGEFLLSLGAESFWDRLVVPALRRLGFARVASKSGIAPSTLADLFSFRTHPQSRHAKRLVRIAALLAAEWLQSHQEPVPPDTASRLALFNSRYDEWAAHVHDDYEWAVKVLKGVQRQSGLISKVAKASGVSRRRIWKLKDPELQQAVVVQVTALELAR